MNDIIIKPLSPLNPREWFCHGDVRAMLRSPFAVFCWDHHVHRLRVLSSVEPILEGGITNPQYHLSISAEGTPGRPAPASAAQALWVVGQFGMEGGEEDNHVPDGVVRNWWRPVADRLVGKECECFELENVQVVGDFVRRPLR